MHHMIFNCIRIKALNLKRKTESHTTIMFTRHLLREFSIWSIHKYSHVVQNIFFYDSMCLPIIFSA